MDLTGIISRAARSCFQRFPAPAAFATALAAYGIFVILSEPKTDQLVGAIAYFLSVGFVLSLSLKLWSEEHQWSRKDWVIHSTAYLILLVDAIYLYHINFGQGGHGYETFLMHASAILALTLTVFFLSFNRERTDIPSWNFALRVIASGVICVAIGLILWGGLSLLLTSLNWLFNINLGWKWYSITGVLVVGYLPALLFLGRIPGGDEKHDREPLRSAFLAGVFRYLFMPLELLYIVVLFIYAIQILVSWELPNGQVSWLVIASMVGLIAIEFGLSPPRHADDRPSDHSVARWLPLILTPLLLLMTVGIVRRFSDYGITFARLYLATLNAWFYIVCLGLFFTRARRIHWIPISFAALFLLTSALPLNYTSLTRRTLLKEVERALMQAGATTLPVDAARFDAIMKSLPAQEASRISSKLKYLEQTFSSATIEPLTTQKAVPIPFKQYIDGIETRDIATPDYNGFVQIKQIHIPDGYTELYLGVECRNYSIDLRQDTIEVPVTNDEVSDTIIVSLSALRALDKQMDDLVALPTKSSDNRFFLQQFFLYEGMTSDEGDRITSAELNLSGYLITRGTTE